MTVTPAVRARVEPDLIADARERAGLPPDAGVTEVLRYALALAAGRPDPYQVAAPRPHGPRRARGRQQA
jgi:hypothetical protein